MKNRAAVKSLVRCTHFLVCIHLPQTTKFEKLVDLVVSCGSETLTYFIAARNTLYTSHVVAIEFVEALSMWIEESTLSAFREHLTIYHHGR